jgi:hypothetical protein
VRLSGGLCRSGSLSHRTVKPGKRGQNSFGVSRALPPGGVGPNPRICLFPVWPFYRPVLVTDELWKRLLPILPRERPKPKGGLPRMPDRQCFTGILI